MHPALEPSNLDRLTKGLRTRAKAAIAGSADQRLQFVLLLTKKMSDWPSEDLPLLLPIFGIILDPTNIDTALNQLDSPTVQPDSDVRVVGALFSLRGIQLLMARDAVPSEVLGELWTLMWPWMEFMDEHRDFLPTIDLLAAAPRHSLFMSLIGMFLADVHVASLIHTSPGVCAVVGSGWLHLTKTKSDPDELAKIYQFLELWFAEREWTAASFDALVMGSGGTRNDLALHIIAPVLRSLPRLDTMVTDHTVFNIGAVFNFVGHTTGVFGRRGDPAFRDELLSLGIVTALTAVARVFALSNLSTAWNELEKIFHILVDYLSSFPLHVRMLESVRSGLLSTILACGCARNIDETRTPLVKLLRNILPASTVYRSVVWHLQTYLTNMGGTRSCCDFGRPRCCRALEIVSGIGGTAAPTFG
ncbi:hypothetical protein MSAN_01631800 [Mycena sanguinolenta]|uniref:Uncharacterized protein n=1 Tax=Mycena sanguinolenta TaxID=230812 RepID=A0A8H6XZX6_9AGAR|nr:hypothetical protein MSAN_01631800 [Mycena sanguinolenta]